MVFLAKFLYRKWSWHGLQNLYQKIKYVLGVQRKEIRQGIACVKHQNMSGSDMGDDHKEYFSGDAALKAGGKDNTMNQFG